MSKNSAKVSIVLPTYNGAKYIRQSIDSCLNQTYKNIELIIVDDGSTDKTSEIIKSYNDNRIKYIKHEKNIGLPYALNTGFANATGDYLTWISDDNYYAEYAIEKMLSFMKINNCEFVYCDFYRFNDKVSTEIHVVKLPKNLNLEINNHIGPCFLYTEKVKRYIGNYDSDTQLAEDYDYWIRISKQFNMYHIDEPLYYFRVHKESLYVSKYYEVKVVDFLVRIKNNILNEGKVTNLFINLIVQKKINRLQVIYRKRFLKTIISKIIKLMVTIIFFKQINNILKKYSNQKMSFQNAKFELKNIVEKN